MEAAGRDHHRADFRQHRPRPGDGGRDQGLQHGLRDARQDVGREDQLAACVRRGRGRLPDQRRAGVAAVVLLGRRAPVPRDSRRVPAQPVLQPAQPRGPLPHDGAGDLGADRGSRRRFRRRHGHGRHDQRGRAISEGKEAIGPDRRRRSRGLDLLGACPPLQGRGSGRGLHARNDGHQAHRPGGAGQRQAVVRGRAQARARGGHPRRRLVGHGPARSSRGGARSRSRRRDSGAVPRHRPQLPEQVLQRRMDAPERIPGAPGRGANPRGDGRARANTASPSCP